jgi:ATP synthase subunit 6
MIETLTLFSALEQFNDSPIFQTVLLDNSADIVPYRKYMLDQGDMYRLISYNMVAYIDCLYADLSNPTSHITSEYCLPREHYEMMIYLSKQRLATIDDFFSSTEQLAAIRDGVFNPVPPKKGYFASPFQKKTVAHYVLERERIAVDILIDECFKHYQISPFAAENLVYRVTHMETSFEDILSYFEEGFEGPDWAFYELVERKFSRRIENFRKNHVKNHGFFQQNTYERIYTRAIELKELRKVSFDIAYKFAFREYFHSCMFLDLITPILPNITLPDFNYYAEIIPIFRKFVILYTLLHEKRLIEDDIEMHAYHIQKCHDNPEISPTCVWTFDYPYIKIDLESCKCCTTLNMITEPNLKLLAPPFLSGTLYVQRNPKDYNHAVADLLTDMYDTLLNIENLRNAQFSVVFISLTRLHVFTVFVALLFILMFYVFCYKLYIILPNMYQFFYESVYTFILDIVCEQAGVLAVVHFPLVFSIFNVILTGNLIGLVPYGFTITSHLTFTFSLGLFVFIGIIILTILNKRSHFINLFIPTGVPKALIPLLTVIEVISYVFRVISLSVRLFANMMAGHALLHILLGFVPVICSFKNVIRFLFIFPIVIIILITVLEIGISLLQSYVFIVLISIYLRDCYGKGSH